MAAAVAAANYGAVALSGTVASACRLIYIIVRCFFRTMALALAIGAGPAASQQPDWEPFGFKESGFVFEVPPGFEMSQTAETGQGATFDGPNGARLAVWGADLEREDFKAQIDSQLAQDRKEGWELTYIRVTADWASYSGTKEDQIRYFRAITVCGGRAAVFLFDYPRSEKIAYDPVVVRLVRSFEAEGC
jgi:hypothetical protein